MTVATNSKAVATAMRNVLDFLQDSELALFTNPVLETPSRVTFPLNAQGPFLVDRSHPGIEQYRQWVGANAYSALLPDASLLQFTYDLDGTEVKGHRLAYIPCPYEVDQELLTSEPILDVVDVSQHSGYLMRSPLRFDFDRDACKPGHPAAHLTINGTDCRMACIAALHPLRFVDFVYRHFYPGLWKAHPDFFGEAPFRHIG